MLRQALLPKPCEGRGVVGAGQVWIALALLAGLGLIVPTAIFGGQALEFWKGMLAGRIVIMWYSAVMLATLVRASEARWFATSFWTFCYVWLGLAPLGQALVGRAPYGTAITESAEIYSCGVVLLGMVAWHVGHTVMWRRRRRNERDSSPATIGAARVVFVGLLAIVATPILLLRQGGLFVNWTTREDRAEQLTQIGLGHGAGNSAAGGLITGFALVLPFLACLVLLRYFQANPSILRRLPAWWALSAGVVAVTLLSASPMGNSRFWFGTVIIGLVTSLRPANRAFGRVATILVVIFSLVVIFPYADLFRRDNPHLELHSIAYPLENKLDYDAASQITNGIYAREHLGLQTNGRQLLGAALIWVPRSAWPSKPETTGSLIAEANGFAFTHMSSPLWIEGYVDFGLPGTAVYLLLAGLGSGALDRRYWREFRTSRGSPSLAQIIVPPAAAYSYILLRGSLIGTLPDGLLLIVLAVLVFRSARTHVHQVGGCTRLGASRGSVRRARRRLVKDPRA